MRNMKELLERLKNQVSSKSNLKSVNSNTEKSTLGDLDALAELKEKMDKKK